MAVTLNEISGLRFIAHDKPTCELHNLDNVFQRFKVVEFPLTYVGLSTTQCLDVEVNLRTCAYLKTMHDGQLMKFEEAREISASHRAYEMTCIDERNIMITFKPKTECISKAKSTKHFDNRFVFDLRLIKVDGIRCCTDENHSEIGRYYICGQFDYCNISNHPKIIDFGDVIMGQSVTKYVRFRNESKLIAAKMENVKIVGFIVVPQTFIIYPNSSKKISITAKPTSLKMNSTLGFTIKNYHDHIIENDTDQNNFLSLTVGCKLNVLYHGHQRKLNIESLLKINEKSPDYTYLDKELEMHLERKKVAVNFLEKCKASHAEKSVVKKSCNENIRCYSAPPTVFSNRSATNFCKILKKKIDPYSLNDIQIVPFFVDFGRVGLNTYGKNKVNLKNSSKYDVTIKFHIDDCVVYTEDKLSNITIKLKYNSDIMLTVFCLGFVEGSYRGTFDYTIDDKFHRKHPYFLQVGNPSLVINDKNLKFGMVTNESFVTSVPVRIYNNFNIPVSFSWDEVNIDTPFEIIPSSGCIPHNSCKICDVIYNCKIQTKSKSHEVELLQSKTKKVIPVELSVITRKLSIKFLQPIVIFKDIALNLETIEKVKLENSSREIAVFHVVEPLIPGFRIEPMSGTIRPKMIMTFVLKIKISCVLEFSFDVYLKINNKENVILPVSGNVVEPKLIIHPKCIYIPRVPCNMTTYVPVTFQNTGPVKTIVEVLDTGDENIFNVYAAYGNEKQRVFEFHLEEGQSKTMFIKVFDIFRREYEMYIPFKINGLLGPPDETARSTELIHYIGEYEEQYENNPKVKVKTMNRDISFCRVTGVVTVPWIQFSVEKFEINYSIAGPNTIKFTMQNISKYYLYVTILTSKLAPYFTLDLISEENQSIITETNIKFEMDRKKEVSLQLRFHPKSHGRFVSTALLYLDKHMTIPYYNLTFIGKRQTPNMTCDKYLIVFPPCFVGSISKQIVTLHLECESEKNLFSCVSREEPNLSVTFLDAKIIQVNEILGTIVNVEISVCCNETYARHLMLTFYHEYGSTCELEVSFSITFCPLTLHTDRIIQSMENPYPYFPLPSQPEIYEYLETCLKFLEKWMFQQGFRRDLNPVIPDTFHAISSNMTSQPTATKGKGVNVSFLNFIRRIAGPLMKHVRKITVQGIDEPFKSVKEIHDTYREIIFLLRSRGAQVWNLQARFLLSYEQFVIYSENVTPKCNSDIMLTRDLTSNEDLFNRLNKQSWIDFIIQSYRVFVMNSCFFECVCDTTQRRDVIKVLIDWYNQHIATQHNELRGENKPIKVITNITTDLSDGIAIVSVIMSYCPFLAPNFKHFCEISDDEGKEGDLINNACLIIEAINQLRLYFPLNSKDLLQPHFLQMLFFSVHLFVALPMFTPKEYIYFNPPLLRSSSRILSLAHNQENLTYSYLILNSSQTNFIIEKAASPDNGKKMFLSVKYIANFVEEESCILLIHGYNKTRIFDTYIVFSLSGHVGSLNPLKKCKVIGPMYRPNKVDVLVSSPFNVTAAFEVSLTDIEPTIPVHFKTSSRRIHAFYVCRLNLIDKEITLCGVPKESGQEVQDHKLYLQIICLSTQIGNSWIWFRSEVGQFFIRVTTQPRWDLAIDTLQVKVHSWPLDPCSCGEACECYKTTVLMIPHRNELMLKSLRYALLEHASDIMMQVFDQLTETSTGLIILSMLLAEGGTNMSDVQHILRSEVSFRITSKALLPRIDRVKLDHHSSAILPLPVTVPTDDKSEKYTVTFTSDCGMDIRNYRIIFIETRGE